MTSCNGHLVGRVLLFSDSAACIGEVGLMGWNYMSVEREGENESVKIYLQGE